MGKKVGDLTIATSVDDTDTLVIKQSGESKSATVGQVVSQGDLSTLEDVTIAGESAGDLLIYNGTTGKWENQPLSGDVSVNEDGVVTVPHKTANGSDHGYIDQDVTSGSSPTLDGANITGTPHESANGSSHSYINQDVTIGASPTFTSPALTTSVLTTSVSGTAILDEDDMSSDSDTQLSTQQAIKAYADRLLTKSSIINGDINTINTPTINVWYQPAATFNLTLTAGVYLINLVTGMQIAISGTGFSYCRVSLSTSDTPGTDLIGKTYLSVLTEATTMLNGLSTCAMSQVITLATTKTIYVNISYSNLSGTPSVANIRLRNNIVANNGLLEAIKIGD